MQSKKKEKKFAVTRKRIDSLLKPSLHIRFSACIFCTALRFPITYLVFIIEGKQVIAQSNPNPSQVYDWQSKSKCNFQNGLTIQPKSNHNPTILEKDIGHQIVNVRVLRWNHGITKRHFLSTFYLTEKLFVWKFG